ncbi:MAG: hypothetical protein ACK413_02805, partial [Patescibacteria group bacterium]
MFRVIFYLLLVFLISGLEKTELIARIFLNPTICLVIFFATLEEKFSFLLPILMGLLLDFHSIFNFPLFTISFTITFLTIKFFTE